MSKFELIQSSCVNMKVDAIVNAANKNLLSGGGVCGVIFSKAGIRELTNVCRNIKTPLKDGDVVITSAFSIKNTTHIIHAVGPDFSRTPNATNELYNAYYNSLKVLKENNLRSIAFPMISSGIFSGEIENPVELTTMQCKKAYEDFIEEDPGYEIEVYICAFTMDEYEKAKKVVE